VGNLIQVNNSDLGLGLLFERCPRKYCGETFYNVLRKFNTNAKQAILTRSTTVLSLSLQLEFPGL
jgi:hypothetical protein